MINKVINANHAEVIEVAKARGEVMVKLVTRCEAEW